MPSKKQSSESSFADPHYASAFVERRSQHEIIGSSKPLIDKKNFRRNETMKNMESSAHEFYIKPHQINLQDSTQTVFAHDRSGTVFAHDRSGTTSLFERAELQL